MLEGTATLFAGIGSPIGLDNFSEILNRGYTIIDKTLLIIDFIDFVAIVSIVVLTINHDVYFLYSFFYFSLFFFIETNLFDYARWNRHSLCRNRKSHWP